MQKVKEVKMKSTEASMQIKVTRNGKTLARLHVFFDGDVFVNQASAVLVHMNKVEKCFIEDCTIKHPDTGTVWQIITLKQEE
jgi:hypothetical protein